MIHVMQGYRKVLGMCFLSIFFCFSAGIASMNSASSYVMYHHGFGDRPLTGAGFVGYVQGTFYSAPCYENDLLVAPFYSNESQRVCLKEMSHIVNNLSYQSINSIGFSMGGGTFINLLDKLINYEDNKDFFSGTHVTCPEDAQQILDAINRGKHVLTKPALRMRYATAVIMASSFLSAATCAVITAAAYYACSRYIDKKGKAAIAAQEVSTVSDENIKMKNIIGKISVIASGVLTWFVLKDIISSGYSSLLVNSVLTRLTNGHFDPSHQEPAESLKRIITSDRFTAPVLWHFTRNDDILSGQTEQEVLALFENKNL